MSNVHQTPEIQRRAVRWVLDEYNLTPKLLAELDEAAQDEFYRYVDTVASDMMFNQLKYFRPFKHQLAFFKTGTESQRRGLLAANRSGKSVATCYELAYHLTGQYAPWWEGKRFESNITAYAAGESWAQVALVLQKELLGTEDIKLKYKLGSGAIPRDCINLDSIRADGPNVQSIEIRHVSGRYSTLLFGNYTQEVRNLQGFVLDTALFDEQPPDNVFSELVTRTATKQGQVLCSFTPLKGLNGLVRKFWDKVEGYTHVRVAWDDLPEYDPWGEPFFLQKDRDQLLRDYMPHERDARTRGIPVMGMGAVFPLLDWPLYDSPDYDFDTMPWLERVISLDLGLINDKTVISFMLRDPREEIIWLHRQIIVGGRTEALPEMYLPFLMAPNCFGTPIALPPDAGRPGVYTLTSESVREVFENSGLNVIRNPIFNPPDAQGKTTNNKAFGINLMRQLMEQRKFMVNRSCIEFISECGSYFVDERGKYSDPDDTIDSARYGLLALIQGWGETWNGQIGLENKRNKFAQIRTAYNLKPKKPTTNKPIYEP
jgi:phage terminase large subunit-like protein